MHQITRLQLTIFIEHFLLRQVMVLMLASGDIGSNSQPEEL